MAPWTGATPKARAAAARAKKAYYAKMMAAARIRNFIRRRRARSYFSGPFIHDKPKRILPLARTAAYRRLIRRRYRKRRY